MTSITSRESHSYSSKKYRSCAGSEDISFDETRLSTLMNNINSDEIIPSPAFGASTSAIERSPKYQKGILSSTLKIKTKSDHSNMSLKRRSRYDKLHRHAKVINRQYMINMTNILFHMHKELYKLKRRTHRVEQIVTKKNKTVQPIIRIPRLTKDQLSTISINNDANSIQEEPTISDDIINEIEIPQNIKTKPNKRLNKQKHSKSSIALSKRVRPHIWINNRQKPIDPGKYCSLCRYEYSKRSNFLMHVRNIHKGKFPPKINDQDQSLLEMNEENLDDNFQQEKSDTSNDRSIVPADNEIQPLQMVINELNIAEGRLRPRTSPKSNRQPFSHAKVKCDVCNKFYRVNYIKKHQIRAHSDQEILSHSSEIDNHSNRPDSVSEKQTDQFHSPMDNPTSEENLYTPIAATPKTVTIAEMDTDDVPIRFRADSMKSIFIAVTCLEPHQLELVDQFLDKFSSVASQSPSIDSHTTHLITNDEQNHLRSPLSMKLIEAIAHHCFCVSFRWIVDCLKHDRIIDEESYEIEGDDTEVHPHGGPRRSRLVPNRHSLFKNLCFMVKCTEKSDIRMTNERLEELITTCGGQIITSVTQRLLNRHQIIVLCDMLYVSERRHNYDQCRSLGIHFVSSDWVLESILEYRRKLFSLFEEVPL